MFKTIRKDWLAVKEFSYYLDPFSWNLQSSHSRSCKGAKCPSCQHLWPHMGFLFYSIWTSPNVTTDICTRRITSANQSAWSRMINVVLSWEKVQSNIYSIHNLHSSQILIAWHMSLLPQLIWESWQFSFLGCSGKKESRSQRKADGQYLSLPESGLSSNIGGNFNLGRYHQGAATQCLDHRGLSAWIQFITADK